MEVSGLRGELAAEEIERGLAPASGGLTACFEKEARGKRFLGGAIELRFRVDRSGAVKWVQMARSDLGAWPVERCLLEVARGLQFARPRGGEAEFSVPLEFAAARPVQSWDEARVQEETRKKLAELGRCSGAPERAAVTLYVANRGRVESVGFAYAGEVPVGPEWAECAAEVARRWQFSDPRGRVAKLTFEYAGADSRTGGDAEE
jgi:TonB family protein